MQEEMQEEEDTIQTIEEIEVTTEATIEEEVEEDREAIIEEEEIMEIEVEDYQEPHYLESSLLPILYLKVISSSSSSLDSRINHHSYSSMQGTEQVNQHSTLIQLLLLLHRLQIRLLKNSNNSS